MIVCSCNVLSEADIRAALVDADMPLRSAVEVYGCLGCSPKCGRCARSIQKIMTEASSSGGACACCVSSDDDRERPGTLRQNATLHVPGR